MHSIYFLYVLNILIIYNNEGNNCLDESSLKPIIKNSIYLCPSQVLVNVKTCYYYYSNAKNNDTYFFIL